jgi:hypothetical protein
MSFVTGTQTEVLFAGPATYQAAGGATAGWAQVAGAVTTLQNLVVGATGASGGSDVVQPQIPAGFWQQGRANQLITVSATGIVSWVATASTTATFEFGLTDTKQGTTTGAVAGTKTVLLTSQAYPNNSTAQTNIAWRFDFDILARQVGFGTTAVSTALLATGVGGFTAATNANSIWGPLPPQVVTTIDASVNYYLYGAVTFGTNASASNTCTMLRMLVFGCN